MGDQAKKRPARKQVDQPITAREEKYATGTVNIWTGRQLREYRQPKEGRGTKIKSEYRCHPKIDEGWTRGQEMGNHYCCLYFARGICHHGSDCHFLHRVPTEEDENRHRSDFGSDIFGRERRPDALGTKDVGSYSRVCTTLYMYLGGAATLPQERIEQLVRQNFAEWGPIEDVRVIPSKAIAFVRYSWRASAEFAKAAMHQQSLARDIDAPLDVRWANDDSNPIAQDRVKREREELMATAYIDSLSKVDETTKRAKLHALELSAGYRPGAAAAAYPDTSGQYEQNDNQQGTSAGYSTQNNDNTLLENRDYWAKRTSGGTAAAAAAGGVNHNTGSIAGHGSEYVEVGGWDARAYAELGISPKVLLNQQGGQQQEQQQHQEGYVWTEDDYRRYYSQYRDIPQDDDDGGGGGGGYMTPEEYEVYLAQQAQHQEGKSDQKEEENNEDAVAQEALGLIGDYGSDSDDDNDNNKDKEQTEKEQK